ncbi:hypothetical protein [Lutibacter agarilyticus]|nr:hypothetical protein [Lutibacter agarilyticus]
MKKLLQILILLIITSCGSMKNSNEIIADEKFELCNKLRLESRINNLAPDNSKPIYNQNIYSLFENFLIQENYLTEISKKGYSQLLDKIKLNEKKSDLIDKFSSELGYDPYFGFSPNTRLSCYGYLFEQLKILDKSSWQYEFCLAYNKFESVGIDKENYDYLKNAMNKIPDKKFEKIVYRIIFLDLIYFELE